VSGARARESTFLFLHVAFLRYRHVALYFATRRDARPAARVQRPIAGRSMKKRRSRSIDRRRARDAREAPQRVDRATVENVD